MVYSICIPINMHRERPLLKLGKPILLKTLFTALSNSYSLSCFEEGSIKTHLHLAFVQRRIYIDAKSSNVIRGSYNIK